MNFYDLTEKEKLIYFAGLMDGEGHFGLQLYSGRPRPIVQLGMTCEKTVKLFAEFFGEKVRYKQPPSKIKEIEEKGHKPIYKVRVECQKAYPIIKALLPYLNTKESDARRCLAYYDDRECSVCKGQIPYTKNWSSVVCSGTCYKTYKNSYDRNRRKVLKQENRTLLCEKISSIKGSVEEAIEHTKEIFGSAGA